jgi:hypothetical protein
MGLEQFGTQVTDLPRIKTVFLQSETQSPSQGLAVLPEETKAAGEICQWSVGLGGAFRAAPITKKILPAGVYTPRYDSSRSQPWLEKKELHTDELIEFKNSLSDTIIQEIEQFWNSKQEYLNHRLLYKRGYLLYGKAGCGKSNLINIIINRVIQRNGIVLYCDSSGPGVLVLCIYMIRKIEPERHIVAIYEDLDAIIANSSEALVLSVLDGDEQSDDVLNIATTNYPEKLDKRIVCRPRRFDRRIEIGPPNESIREEYFIKKLNIPNNEVQKWVRATEGMPFAALTDLVAQVTCLKVPFDSAVDRINDLVNGGLPNSDNYNNNKMGFME